MLPESLWLEGVSAIVIGLCYPMLVGPSKTANMPGMVEYQAWCFFDNCEV